jgi:hypothetical protein
MLPRDPPCLFAPLRAVGKSSGESPVTLLVPCGPSLTHGPCRGICVWSARHVQAISETLEPLGHLIEVAPGAFQEGLGQQHVEEATRLY